MNMTHNIKIFIIAGEKSGDNLGAKLINALSNQNSNIEFAGIGGENMIKEGIISLFPMNELSIMGFVEIIPFIPKLFKRINQTVKYIQEFKPDILVTIDSPGFNFRIAKKIKQINLGIKLIHYVAPTVWAYKPKRAEKIAKIFDHLLVLLPWEPPYFTKHGLKTSFVGHAIIENKIQGNTQAFISKYDIANDKIICLMPGSRRREIKTLLPIFIEAIEIISKTISNLTIIIPTISYLKPIIEELLTNLPHKYIILTDQTDISNGLSASSGAIVKSGTVSLDVAMHNIPMIIAYKINKISAYILKKMIKVKYVTLINIINDKLVIPEYLQEDCNPMKLTEGLKDLLDNDEANESQKIGIDYALSQLGYNDPILPSEKAAKIILNEIIQL